MTHRILRPQLLALAMVTTAVVTIAVAWMKHDAVVGTPDSDAAMRTLGATAAPVGDGPKITVDVAKPARRDPAHHTKEPQRVSLRPRADPMSDATRFLDAFQRERTRTPVKVVTRSDRTASLLVRRWLRGGGDETPSR